MRERIRDSFPRPPSPSPTRDRDDANESSKAIRRSGQSPFQIDAVSCGIDDRRTFREHSVDGIRREITYSAPYELDRPKRDGFSDEGRREHSHLHTKAFSGVDYTNRSGSLEIVQRRCGASMRYSEDPYTEQFRSPVNHLSDEPSRFIPLHDFNVYSPSHDKTDRLESFFRDCIDSSRHRSKPFPESEVKQTEAITVATKGESSPLSQIGSSGVDFQDESSKCCIRANDLDRVNDARPSYSGNHCVSQVLQRDDHVGRNSPRDQQGECMRGLSYGDRGSPSVSRCGKEVVDESLKICRIGSDIEARETFPCVGNMARETDLLMQAARGSLSKSYVRGSDIVDVNAADTHLEFSTKEKTTDQHYFVKERHPFVELGSSVVNEQDDKAHQQMNFPCRKRDVVYLDQKCQLLENDGVNGPVGESNRYDKAPPQSKRLCLNNEREEYLDNERKAVYSDDKRRELGNEYCFGNDRMHSDLHEAGIVVDRDDKAPQSKMICLKKERETCMESERKAVYSDDKRRELRNEYRFRNDDRVHSDLREADIVVDRDDKAPQNRTVCYNKEREAYLDNEKKAVYLNDERREMRNEYHFGHDSRMHSDVHERDIVVDRDGKVVKHGQVCLNKGEAAYLDNERRDVYLHYRSQQLKRDYDSGTDARIYPDVRRLDIVVDHEDARDLSYRAVSNDRKEPYLQCESQQRLKDHETAPYGMIHSGVNKSDFLVNGEEARALEHRGVYYDDGKESYLDTERRDRYMRYKNQQRKKDYDYGIDDRVYRDVSSDIIVDHGDARALERRGVSYNDEKEAYLENERRDGYLRYKNHQLKEDYDFGIDDKMYHDGNRSQIVVDQRVDRGLEVRELSFNDGNEAYLDNRRRDAYPRYKTQQAKKDYDSGIDARMCHDVNRSEIVVDRELARASERRGVSLYDDGREAYLHHESQKLQKDHEIDSYGMMHPDVSRSSACKQDEEARRYRRYRFDDRKQMSLDDECLQLRNGGHVKAHANMRYPNGRQEVVYRSNDEILLTRDGNGLRPGVVIHEKMADDYKYSNVKQLGMSDEKPYRGRFRDREVAYDYRDKLGNHAVEGGTSTERFRYLADERNSGKDDHTSAPRPRISAKERLGGRVEESRVPVKYRLLHPVKNPKVKGKSHHNRWRNQP